VIPRPIETPRSVPERRADAATRVSAKPEPRSHLASLLRSGRQLLANLPFNESDTALRDSVFLESGAIPQVVSEAKDNFRKDDDPAWRDWQWSGATWTTEGCPQGERGGVHQFGVPPKGNANFAWVQHFIHHLAPHDSRCGKRNAAYRFRSSASARHRACGKCRRSTNIEKFHGISK
jgi:hypothetical protein